jgi:S-adenosyl-L-methionine hydrolase (adenosine-forming)
MSKGLAASGIITLTTDFGISDGYAASVKAVILSINPGANIVDVSHAIKPQHILQASFVINSVYSYFPANTIHLVVVDPGVGSERKAIILKTPSAYFVAPDNGVLSYVVDGLASIQTSSVSDRSFALRKWKIPEIGDAFGLNQITNKKYMLNQVSSTFHGRDVFGPAAAYLSLGVPEDEFGKPLKYLNIFPVPKPVQKNNLLEGNVIYVDGFGNLITNFKSDNLEAAGFEIKIGGFSISRLSHFYQEKKGLAAIIGSSGYLEISLTNGSAAAFLRARVGDVVELVFQP